MAAHLSAFAERRAHPGPVRDRDLILEAREELADCRNYIVWALQAGQIDPDPALDALASVIAAYARLTPQAAGVKPGR